MANSMKEQNVSFNYSNLHGKIISVFGSLSGFANELGVSPSSVSKVIRLGTPMSSLAIVKWCRLLEIDLTDVGSMFYTVKVQTIES